jgi:hypothetical protein
LPRPKQSQTIVGRPNVQHPLSFSLRTSRARVRDSCFLQAAQKSPVLQQFYSSTRVLLLGLNRLEAVAAVSRICSRVVFGSCAPRATEYRFGSHDRLMLIVHGLLSVMLAQSLIFCVTSARCCLRLATAILSQAQTPKHSSATCVATLLGHCDSVDSVTFHLSGALVPPRYFSSDGLLYHFLTCSVKSCERTVRLRPILAKTLVKSYVRPL